MAHATNKRAPILTPARRRWAYNVFLAAFTLLIAYKVVDQQFAELWKDLASILIVGVARANVPTQEGGAGNA